MGRTLCFTGMDPADRESLEKRFAEANQRAGGQWRLAAEREADVLVIDVESMYGHMTWLKQHRTGRRIVALASSQSVEAERTLRRPVTFDALVQLLHALEDGGAEGPTATHRPSHADALVDKTADTDLPPRTAAQQPAEAPGDAEPVLASTASAAKTAPRLGTHLLDFLRPGALPGPARLELPNAPPLLVDPIRRAWLCRGTLRPYLPYATATVRAQDWQPLATDALDASAATLGGRQPWERLLWLAGLRDRDALLAQADNLDRRYRLKRWPPIEREFPKHFRIATAMMKEAASIAGIADASGTSREDVAEFVAASLASGAAERQVPGPPLQPPGAKSGLLGRLRGR